MAPLNAPFWSLNYEAWYYAIFAAWTYLRAPWRLPFSVILVLAAGPKIILLMPCWLLGVWIYHHRPAMPQQTALLYFVASVVAYFVVFMLDVPVVIRNRMDGVWPELMHSLGGSRTFVGDYLLAGLIALNFIAVSNMSGGLLHHFQAPIRTAAGFTLSVYLYHMPMFALLWAGMGWRHWSIVLPLAAGLVGLGLLTEHKRQSWREAMRRILYHRRRVNLS